MSSLDNQAARKRTATHAKLNSTLVPHKLLKTTATPASPYSALTDIHAELNRQNLFPVPLGGLITDYVGVRKTWQPCPCVKLSHEDRNYCKRLVWSPATQTWIGVTSAGAILRWNVTNPPTRTVLEEVYGTITIPSTLSPDGTLFASRTSKGRGITFWDTQTSRALATIPVKQNGAEAVFSPDGTMVAVNEYDTLSLWHPRTGAALKHLPHKGYYTVVFSPDGSFVAWSSMHTVHLWNTRTGELLPPFKGHSNSINYLTFSADGNTLASSSMDQTVRLWNPKTGEALAVLREHPSYVDSATFSSVTFSPDHNIVASVFGNRIYLWEVKTGRAAGLLQGHTDYIRPVVFSSDSNALASCSGDGTVRIWDVQTHQALFTGLCGYCSQLSFSPDGDTLVVSGPSPVLRAWSGIPQWRTRLPLRT